MKQPSSPTKPLPLQKRRLHWFALAALGLLIITTVFWAILAARLQAANADQLIDSYLFESPQTFHAATFPGAHTFLLKWPLFALAALCGSSATAITILTVLCALAPVLLIAAVIYKTERRPVVFGAWCLVLSLCLLVSPAQPAPGTLLPVNFGMLATRNIEYVLFALIAWLLIKSRRWYDGYSLGAVAATAVLLASDRLFAPLLLGAVGLLLAVRLIWPKRGLLGRGQRRQWHWLIIAVVGTALSYAIIAAIIHWRITGITTQSQPYQLVRDPKTIGQAIAYAGLGLLTLFGANPIYSQLALAGSASAARDSLHSLTFVGYAINFGLVVTMIGLGLRLLLDRKRLRLAPANLLLFNGFMLAASLVATAVFISTNHYYPVDSRYLAIWLFALPPLAALSVRRLPLKPRTQVLTVLGLLLTLPFAAYTGYRQYQAGERVGQLQHSFQQAVAQQLNRYQPSVVIGDYWDVVPIRSQMHTQPALVPLAQCDQPQRALSSTAWRYAPLGSSVAYVINSQPAPTGFKTCSPAAVQAKLGTPTTILPITMPGHEGSAMYLYQHGIRALVHAPQVQPYVTPALKPATDCRRGTTMTVIAHEDDDLLFMNPDVQTALDDGQCLTTVYLTAGDAGADRSYWSSRRDGAEAAYATMLNRPDRWVAQQRRIDGRTLDSSVLVSVPRVRLLFINLPDGNLDGSGFASTEHVSLAKLRTGSLTAISSVDITQSYTRGQLIDLLTKLMDVYHPNQVLTQNYSSNVHDGDHSDHHATGYFARQAFQQYAGSGTLKSYMGYPVAGRARNVYKTAFDRKETTFFAYGAHDGAACDSEVICDGSTVYGRYLPRQYSRTVASHVLPIVTRPIIPTAATAVKPRLRPSLHPGDCVIGGARQLIYCLPRR